MKFKLLIVLFVAALTACVHHKEFAPGPQLKLAAGNVLPPPASIDPSSDTRPYFIGPFDTLSVKIFGLPELDQRVQVDASGRVSLPLIGGIVAQGKTPADLAAAIEQALRGRYVRDPQVSVNLEETVSQVVTIDGQVREPGLYPVLGKLTLMRAIASAKGATEYARLEDVVVFRKVGDQDMAALYNLEAIRRGMYADPEVFANDVIVVGDSPARRMFRDIIQAGGLIVSPIIAVLQRI